MSTAAQTGLLIWEDLPLNSILSSVFWIHGKSSPEFSEISNKGIMLSLKVLCTGSN